MTKPDLASVNHGTFIIINAVSARGRKWLHENVHDTSVFGEMARETGLLNSSVSCEHRYGIDILLAALAAGLKLRDETSGVTVDRNTSAYDKYRTDVLDPRD